MEKRIAELIERYKKQYHPPNLKCYLVKMVFPDVGCEEDINDRYEHLILKGKLSAQELSRLARALHVMPSDILSRKIYDYLSVEKETLLTAIFINGLAHMDFEEKIYGKIAKEIVEGFHFRNNDLEAMYEIISNNS